MSRLSHAVSWNSEYFLSKLGTRLIINNTWSLQAIGTLSARNMTASYRSPECLSWLNSRFMRRNCKMDFITIYVHVANYRELRCGRLCFRSVCLCLCTGYLGKVLYSFRWMLAYWKTLFLAWILGYPSLDRGTQKDKKFRSKIWPGVTTKFSTKTHEGQG